MSKQFIFQYKTVEDMSERSREEEEKTVFSSVFEKKTLEFESMVSCSVYSRNAAIFPGERT